LAGESSLEWLHQVREVHRSFINSESRTSLIKAGVSILATQTMHYYGEIPQHYHTAVLFFSTKMGKFND